ncbi:restriction endonuclease [Dongia sp.]|uniref:restriction endonuclease n=1 Tax=Dongia sp. TaxID=1977262 RepID=UPI0035AF5512
MDELTGMSSGYVLDFTNATFAEFFRSEVGVNIYDDAYAAIGNSKGKRLRSFLQIGQRVAIVKALTALWEYRENARINQEKAETVTRARQRLSAIVERLGGIQRPEYGEAIEQESKSESKGPSAAQIAQLDADFLALHGMAPQARGYAFEKFLTKLFDAWGMDARAGFRVVGEQIDGSFQHDSATYLVEAKWHNTRTEASTLHAFQGKIEERPQWTRGLFVSYEGFTEGALKAFTARRIIMMDGMDIYDAIRRCISLPAIITEKARHASEYRNPFERVRSLFPEK